MGIGDSIVRLEGFESYSDAETVLRLLDSRKFNVKCVRCII